MFCDGNARCGGNQGGGGGDIESGKSAAGAAGIHQFFHDLGLLRNTVGADRLGKGGQFFQTGSLHQETDLKTGDLYVGDLVMVDGSNQIKNLSFRQLLTGSNIRQDFLINVSIILKKMNSKMNDSPSIRERTIL